MNSHPDNAKALFLNAVEMASASERQAYLDSACAGDETLRREVEELLRHHERMGAFLQSAGSAQPATGDGQPLREGPGTVIGPYKLLQQIGEGGMGTVFMAEQTRPVQRKVALKVIKAGMDSRQVIARFEAERQALAMMDHVNIARVFDGGTTENGRPYFVMELVHGVPITKYCDDNRLTPRERLELFVPVCQAIQHAHQKGIIHRDLKSSNVMVTLYDGKPVPKVIDFGVAKATEQKLTERTLFTQYGTLVGTLEYMSPEQAEMSALGVDTRSDIYALGVLLYELLTGSTPLSQKRLKEAAYGEILRMIREEEAPRPSTRLSDSGEALVSISAQRHTEPAKLTKLVRGELDWIALKALDKDRNRRYETAKDFAADVQRYLNDEPVQACPPSVLYRFRKFARRNKAAIGVAGMVLLFLVLLGSGAGWALRDREAREQEVAQETARKLALTEQGIHQALDRGTTSRDELHGILKRPGGVQQLLNQPARYSLLIKTAHGELAQARRLAVGAETRLGVEWTQAMDQFEQQLTGDQADYDLALRLETIRLDSAATLGKGGFSNRGAADEYAKAFNDFGVPNDDPATVAERLRSSPIKDQLVAALDHWAWLAFYLRDRDLMGKLLATARQTVPDPAWGDRLREPEVWYDHEALAKLVAEAPSAALSPHLLGLVGRLLRDVNNPLKEPWLRKAQAEHPADFWLNYDLAIACRRTNPVESAGYCRVALAVRPGSAAAYNSLGNALEADGKLDEASAAYHKAIAITKYTRAHAGLGKILMAQGKLDDAIASFRKGIEVDPKYADAHNFLGIALKRQNKLDDAADAYRAALAIDPKNALAHYNLGNLLYTQNKLDDAADAYRTSIIFDPKYVPAHQSLGNCLRDLNKLDEAIACYRICLKLDPKSARAHDGLGFALGRKGWELANHPDPKLRDLKRAFELGNEAVELAPQSTWAWRHLGWIRYRAGNWKAGIEALEKSCKLQKEGTGDAFQWFFLAMAHWQLGDRDEARKWHDRAALWMDKHQPSHEELRRFRAEADVLLGVKQKRE